MIMLHFSIISWLYYIITLETYLVINTAVLCLQSSGVTRVHRCKKQNGALLFFLTYSGQRLTLWKFAWRKMTTKRYSTNPYCTKTFYILSFSKITNQVHISVTHVFKTCYMIKVFFLTPFCAPWNWRPRQLPPPLPS